jgi:acyl carrier protein
MTSISSSSDIQAWLIEWLVERNPDTEPRPQENYYDTGLVDSFGVIELIEEIENRYAILFDDDDFTLPEFRTIEGLVQLIQQKQSAAAQ